MAMYTLLYLKWIANKDLLYRTGNSMLNVMWQSGRGAEFGENGCMYVCG